MQLKSRATASEVLFLWFRCAYPERMAKRKDGRTPPPAHSHAPEHGVHAFELLRPAASGVHALLATAVPGRGLVPLPRGGHAPAGVGCAP